MDDSRTDASGAATTDRMGLLSQQLLESVRARLGEAEPGSLEREPAFVPDQTPQYDFRFQANVLKKSLEATDRDLDLFKEQIDTPKVRGMSRRELAKAWAAYEINGGQAIVPGVGKEAARGGAATRFVRGVNEGFTGMLATGVAGTIGTAMEAAGSKEEAERFYAVAREYQDEFDAGPGLAAGAGRVVGSVAPSLVPAVGAASMARAGLAGAQAASRGIGNLILLDYGVSAFGNEAVAYRDAMDSRGLTPQIQEQIVHGTGAALAEIVAEKIGLDFITHRLTAPVARRVGDAWFKGDVGRAAAIIAGEMGMQAGVNAAEEALTETANALRQKYGIPGLAEGTNPEMTGREVGERALQAGAMGALAGGGVIGPVIGAMRARASRGQGPDAAEQPTPPGGGTPLPTADGGGGAGAGGPVQAGDAEKGVASFLGANKATEGVVIAPESLTPIQRAVTERMARSGARVVFVDAGAPLPFSAANPSPGVIVIDANAEGEQAESRLAWHEAVDDIEARDPGLFAELESDLEALVPERMRAARERYAARWKAATGQDISPDRLRSEGPANVAEMLVDAITVEDDQPGSLGMMLAQAEPRVRDRLLSALQAIMRRMGLYSGATRVERAAAVLAQADSLGGREALQAAAAIREAVSLLRPLLIAEPADGDARVDVASQSTAAVDAAAPGGELGIESVAESEPVGQADSLADPASEPSAPATVRDRKGAEFTNARVRRRLLEIANSSGRPEQESSEEFVEDGDQYGMEFDTNFSGPLPGDIKSEIQGLPANIRMRFRGNVPGGSGEDVMAAIGADAMVARVRRRIQGQDSRVQELIESGDALETLSADGGMLAMIRQLRGSLPVGDIVPYEIVENPAALPEGATFSIQDSEFVVSRGEQGTRAVSMADPRQSFSLDGVESMPVDRRTLRRNAGAAVPEVDDLADIPFAIAPPVDSPAFRRWFGDSKVVDEQGRPLVVYKAIATYGQPEAPDVSVVNRDSEFPAFNRGESGVKIAGFFARDPEVANRFTRMTQPLSPVMAAYLSIQKPFRIDAAGRMAGDIQFGESGRPFRDAIRSGTYDGVIIENTADEGDIYVALRPEQVKSATGNRGTFDPSNPDIRFAVRDPERAVRDAGRVMESGAIPKNMRFAVRNDQPDLPGATPAQTRITPEGRPDLANPGRTNEVRDFVDAIDELRNRAGEPDTVANAETERQAAEIMSRDFDGAMYRTKQKVARGEVLTAIETVILAEGVNRQVRTVLRTGDAKLYTEAARTTWEYRRSGTAQARALQIRRDRVAGPSQRYREALMNAMLAPTRKMRERLSDIADKLQDPDIGPVQRTKLQKQESVLFDRMGKRAERITGDLQRNGIDPRSITAETMQDPVFAAIVTNTVRQAQGQLTDDLYWVWMNSILSGPLTHAANLIGNTANMMYRYGPLRLVESAIGSAVNAAGAGKSPDTSTLSEYAYLVTHAWESAAVGWSFMTRAWATNRQVFDEQILGESLPLFDIKGESLRLPDAGPRNKALRAMGLWGWPLKLLMVSDQFFKSMAGNMEARGKAYRRAKADGYVGAAALRRADQLIEDWSSPIWQEAYEESLVAVFQDEASPVGQAAKQVRRIIPLAEYAMPFINTPDRLLVRGLEISPVGPLIAAYKGINAYRAGDTEAAIKAAAGGMLALGLIATIAGLRDDEDERPVITGSAARQWRDSAEQYRTAPPQSVRIAGQWYSYARIEPLGTGLALAIDTLERWQETGDPVDAGLDSWKSLLAVMEDKTFLRTVGEILEAVRKPDESADLVGGLARSTFVTAWVPNLFKQPMRAVDGVLRDRTPDPDAMWWSKQASLVPYEAAPAGALGPPIKHDIWGREIRRSSPFGEDGAFAAMYRMAVPIAVSKDDLHPLDAMIGRFNVKARDGAFGDLAGEDGFNQNGEFHPSEPKRFWKSRGMKYELDAEEYQAMVRDVGQAASERLLDMSLNFDDPAVRDVERVRAVYRQEHTKWKRSYERSQR